MLRLNFSLRSPFFIRYTTVWHSLWHISCQCIFKRCHISTFPVAAFLMCDRSEQLLSRLISNVVGHPEGADDEPQHLLFVISHFFLLLIIVIYLLCTMKQITPL